MKKNSIWGIVSFILLISGIILLILYNIRTDLEKYIYTSTPYMSDFTENILAISLTISFTGSLATSIIASFKRNVKKTLATISLSITIFILFLILLFVLEPTLLSYNIKYGVVTNYGVFDIPSIKINNQKRTLYAERVLKNNTNEITAEMGLRFGFNYVIAGEPDGKEITIEKIIKYPEPGLKINNKMVVSDTSFFDVNLNELKYSGYIFENEYELIPGEWEINFFYNGKKILSQVFQIKKKTVII